ncbi:MAG: DUF2147 domain-containing protein [Burkholderiaceae bacterium]
MNKQLLAALAIFTFATAAHAQMTPVGTWHTIDDKTNEVKTEVVISESGGVVTGKITKLLRKGANQEAVCDKCSDDRKGKAILGMEIIREVRKVDGKEVWEGGKVLDPESGSLYSVRLTPIEGGKKLEMRGSFAFISRTQTWVRVP